MQDINIKKENEQKEYEILADLNKRLTNFSKFNNKEKDNNKNER